MVCEVTSLNHELLDNTVEGRAFVSVALFAGRKSSEVLGSLWYCLPIQTHHDPPHRLVIVRDIEIDLVSDLGSFRSFRRLSEVHEDDRADEEYREDNAL